MQEDQYAQEQAMKQGQAMGANCTTGDTLSCKSMSGELRRAGIRERVQNDLNRAGREAYKLEQLHELANLLQKNPEVARILDLIEMVRG